MGCLLVPPRHPPKTAMDLPVGGAVPDGDVDPCSASISYQYRHGWLVGNSGRPLARETKYNACHKEKQ